MRNIILLVLVTIYTSASAQFQPTPTQFDTFINRPSVEWASYANDTIRFKIPHFNKLLITRLANREIKAALPVYSGTSDVNNITFLKIDSIEGRILYPLPGLPLFDSNEINLSANIKTEAFKIDTSGPGLTDVTQILFIEKGLLKSYIPWVSPKVVIIATSNGVPLGKGDYFLTCFNFNYNYLPNKKNIITYLSQTNRKISLDTIEKENKLKELYGRNLIETLWPYIVKNKYTIYLAGSNKKINANEITTDLIEALTVPVFDSSGNMTGKVVKEPLNPGLFTIAELLQDWYYDHTKNIVFNNIKSLVLFAKKWDSQTGFIKPRPILKIVF